MAAAQSQEEQVRLLFVELSGHISSENYPKIVASADKILQLLPSDNDAFSCKIAAIIHQNKPEEALEVLDKNKAFSEKGYLFERAYCLFRLQKLEDALAVVDKVPNASFSVKELKAQILYRLERFDECLALYRSLMKEAKDDFTLERETNAAAAAALALIKTGKPAEEFAIEDSEASYELSYNAACIALAEKDFAGAAKHLGKAEELCRKTLEEEEGELSAEDLEAELALIRVQQGLVHQLQGNNADAMKLYLGVLKSKPDDVALVAVASNNIVALNKDRDVFDSKKKMKATTVDGLSKKLTAAQREAIDLNQCLLLLYTNQNDACRKRCKELEAANPTSDVPCLIHAASLIREKKFDQGYEVLQAFAKEHGGRAERVRLVLAQTCVTQGRHGDALAALAPLGAVRFRPAIVALTVALHAATRAPDAAARALDAAAAHWAAAGDAYTSTLKQILRHSGNYLLAHAQYSEAVAVFEKLARADPDDAASLASLITALCHVDLTQAEQYASSLPQFSTTDVDVDALEAAKTVRRYQASASKDGDAGRVVDLTAAKRKRAKKKRKPRLPRNYNPNVAPDPERWLPRWQRKSFVGKRKKKHLAAVGKGTQGTAGISEKEINALDASLRPTVPVVQAEHPVLPKGKGRKGGRR